MPRNRRAATQFAASVRDSPVPAQCVSMLPACKAGPGARCAVVHPTPLYHVEGEPTRRGEGLYDRMRPIGAHEVLLENPRHDGDLWNSIDAEIEQFLQLAAQRIQDLKRDHRLKYVSRVQEPRRQRRTGIRASQLAAHRHYFCAAPGAL